MQILPSTPSQMQSQVNSPCHAVRLVAIKHLRWAFISLNALFKEHPSICMSRGGGAPWPQAEATVSVSLRRWWERRFGWPMSILTLRSHWVHHRRRVMVIQTWSLETLLHLYQYWILSADSQCTLCVSMQGGHCVWPLMVFYIFSLCWL